MHAIIGFYSRTGSSEALAQAVSREFELLGVSTEPLAVEPRGRLGAVRGAFLALFRRGVPLAEEYELGDADLVVLVGPVWAGNISPPMRQLITQLPPLQGRRVVVLLVGTRRYERLAKTVADELRVLGADWVSSRGLRSAEVRDPDKLSSVVNAIAREVVR